MNRVIVDIHTHPRFSCLSTLYPGWIKYLGENWPSPEHAIAAAKCPEHLRPKLWKEIWKQTTPQNARHLSKRLPTRKDWVQVRDQVLEEVVGLALQENPLLRQRLHDTQSCTLINADGSEFGCEWDELLEQIRGKNKLGNLLMRLRDE